MAVSLYSYVVGKIANSPSPVRFLFSGQTQQDLCLPISWPQPGCVAGVGGMRDRCMGGT